MPQAETSSTVATEPLRDDRTGAAWMMLSVVTAAFMTISVRWASEELDSRVIVGLRAVGGLGLAALAWTAFARLRRSVRFSAPWLHIWRGGLIGVSTHLGFYTITQIPLATATVLFFTAPIFATLLAIPMQGERVGARRGAAIAAGFGGVLIVLRPGAIPFDLAMVAALISSMLFALALLSSRGLANKDGPFSAYISSAFMTVIVSVPLAAPVFALPISAFGWIALVVVVVASIARNIGDIQAYRYADASVLAPLTYTRLILIAVAAYAFFDETPDAFTITGGVVIVGAALYIARRERLVKRAS